MAGYFSEVGYTDDPENFFEVAVPSGTDVSGYSIAIYDGSGVLQTTMNFGSLDATLKGQDVYSFDSTSPGYVEYGASEAIALIDGDGNVVQFVSFEGKTITPGSGPAAGETSTDFGFLNSGETFESSDNGSTYYAQSSPNQGTIPCYASGTLIDTPTGQRLVETLHPGDLVNTLDNGAQAIRWVQCRDHKLDTVAPDNRPVLIKANALGKRRPTHDLVVSPQHRIFVGKPQLRELFQKEYLVHAKSLTGLPGIQRMKGTRQVRWVHFACHRHEVVVANGCYSETLLLGPMVLLGLDRRQRRKMSEVFGKISKADAAQYASPARQCLKVQEVRRHLARRMKTALDKVV